MTQNTEGDSGIKRRRDHHFHQHQLNKHRSTQHSLTAQQKSSIIFRIRLDKSVRKKGAGDVQLHLLHFSSCAISRLAVTSKILRVVTHSLHELRISDAIAFFFYCRLSSFFEIHRRNFVKRNSLNSKHDSNCRKLDWNWVENGTFWSFLNWKTI